MKIKNVIAGLVMAISLSVCTPKKDNLTFSVDRNLSYCNEQVMTSLSRIGDTTLIP